MEQVGAIVQGDFPKGSSPTMTWLGSTTQENKDLSYNFKFIVSIQVWLTDSECMHFKHLSSSKIFFLCVCTSEFLELGTSVTFNSTFLLTPFALPTFKTSIS